MKKIYLLSSFEEAMLKVLMMMAGSDDLVIQSGFAGLRRKRVIRQGRKRTTLAGFNTSAAMNSLPVPPVLVSPEPLACVRVSSLYLLSP